MESYSRSKRLGIIGGSFDPVHAGHLVIAGDAADHLDLSEVLFIPAARPPHKQHVRQSDAEHRLNMVRLAVKADHRFSASDLELQRGGISYTVDTLLQIRAAHPETDLFLIIGSDTLVELHTWHRIDELLKMCTVATLLRPGIDSADLIRQKVCLEEKDRNKLLNHIIPARRMDISSTDIRRRIAAGEKISGLVPAEVEHYIGKHGLYRQ